jgi:hypothetical protein
MTTASPDRGPSESAQTRPWYRYPWPWVAIAIPAIAVAGGLFTLYLAVTNPDPVMVDEQRYEEIRAKLRAQPHAQSEFPATDAARDDADGDG